MHDKLSKIMEIKSRFDHFNVNVTDLDQMWNRRCDTDILRRILQLLPKGFPHHLIRTHESHTIQLCLMFLGKRLYILHGMSGRPDILYAKTGRPESGRIINVALLRIGLSLNLYFECHLLRYRKLQNPLHRIDGKRTAIYPLAIFHTVNCGSI